MSKCLTGFLFPWLDPNKKDLGQQKESEEKICKRQSVANYENQMTSTMTQQRNAAVCERMTDVLRVSVDLLPFLFLSIYYIL